MVKVTALYPNEEGKTFDMEYYCNQHLPMVRHLLGTSCIDMAAEQGVAGGAPGTKATFVAIGHLYFHSINDFVASFNPHADTIIGDIPNFTDTAPVIQISEVKL